MSVIVMGLSHRSAPMSVLERVALTPDQVVRLGQVLCASEHVDEAVIVATCNRLEVYAAALTFHGAVADIGAALVQVTGVEQEALSPHLYVHFEDRAVAHTFRVACGLDSMAVGESQILGQLRSALRSAQVHDQAGTRLNALFQHAFRVGKRAHTETELDRACLTLVDVALAEAAATLGPLSQLSVLIVGAGAMSNVAAHTAAAATPARLTITNRTTARAAHLAAAVGADHRPMSALSQSLASADVIITCTGSVGHVITATRARDVAAVRAQPGCGGLPTGAQVYIDLALPRDVDPDVAHIDGVRVLSLAEIGDLLTGRADTTSALREVADLVTAEVAAYHVDRRMQQVGPTVAALRQRAAAVVEAEMARLDARLPDLDPAHQAEVNRAVHRIVEKLLHTPTVRVKELTGSQQGDYARALRELFDLDPYDVAAVSAPPAPVPGVSS